MKPVTQIVGAAAIAILFGTGGYFLGKNHSPGLASVSSENRGPGNSSKFSDPGHRPVLQTIDTRKLRAELDAEKSPLSRFKLALQNLEAWVAKNPAEALDWLASQQPSERRDDILRRALNQYSEIDAKGAATWAMKNLTGIELNNALITLAENWAQENGAEAATFFLSQPATQERDAAMENALFSWASNEPSAALDFLKANSSLGDLSPVLRRAALAGWAKTEPEAAVSASLALSRTNNDTDQFANTLANWATMDLDASSKWLLANLPAGNERSAAAQELATIFAGQSPEAGLAWLEKLNSGGERDAAASAFAADWSKSGPAEAAKWAATQSSAGLSEEAMAEISRNFLMKDAPAFEAWRSALPPGPLKEQAGKTSVAPDDQ